MSSIAALIEQACLLEATARKPGNVHPGASFVDLSYDDFVRAAEVIAPILAEARACGLGPAVRAAVEATRAATGRNVNLGICLLLAPLAIGAAEGALWTGARRALLTATVDDAHEVYCAIRLAQPGGLGQSPRQDVAERPTLPLREVMALAATRDDVARELSTGFLRLEREIVPCLADAAEHAAAAIPIRSTRPVSTARATTVPAVLPALSALPAWERATVLTHVRLIAEGDTLIRRKCGDEVCRQAAHRAAQLWHLWQESREIPAERLNEFDAWLRADGHRRNPGTSADLVAAALFAALVEQRRPFPSLAELRACRTADRSAAGE
jgi:triphosphoribosyl-dephospho-CoA synthase